jgi:RNA polymerase sigma-70 factor (ECF subfamily)
MNLFCSRRKLFEKLTWPVAQDLYRLAYWRLANRQDAEDVVQDAYLRAYRSFNTFQTGTNVKAWMTRILINVINDTLKKRLNHADVLTIDDESDEIINLESQSASLQDPELQQIAQEIDHDLFAALQKLPSSLLQPLLLRELEDMTYEQIATTLAIPTGTVMSRLFRARKVIRERLTSQTKTPLTQEVSDYEVH